MACISYNEADVPFLSESQGSCDIIRPSDVDRIPYIPTNGTWLLPCTKWTAAAIAVLLCHGRVWCF